MTSDLSIAVVGAGLIGQKHLEIVCRHARLCAVADPDETADTRDAPRYETLETLLEKHQPDGVIVASPNQLHLAHGAACIARGIPALIEKPLAEKSATAAELARLANEADVPLLVGHHRRHSPLVRAAKTAIDGGVLGDLVSVAAQFWLIKPPEYYDAAWRRAHGAGPTYINLIHDIDLLRHFCGDIVAVQARESNRQRGFEVEDTSAVILEFASGVLGTVSISDTVSAPWSWEMTSGENPAYPKTDQSCYMIGGTQGSLSVPDMHLWSHPTRPSWWEPINARQLDFTTADPVEQQFLHFLDVINGKATPRVTAADGLQNIEVLDAIKAAAISGKRELVTKG